MLATETRWERRALRRVLANVNEAAFVSGVSRHAVNQAIDRGEIRTREPERTLPGEMGVRGRRVGIAELIYLNVHVLLSTRGRKAVYKKLVRLDLDSDPPALELDNGVRLDISGPVAEIRARLEEIARVKRTVEENPEIRGGEPVFRGTRIPGTDDRQLRAAGRPRRGDPGGLSGTYGGFAARRHPIRGAVPPPWPSQAALVACRRADARHPPRRPRGRADGRRR